MIRRILRKERTEYGKAVRKKYEAGEFWDSRHNMTRYAIRPDELSNTLSTVLKDNLLIEINGIEESFVFNENKPKEDDNLTINKPFTYVSLFSGVGGFEQALNKLGGKCVMASEIDKYANLAYETLYGHKTVGDITKVAAESVPDHDLLVGGFPCQAFSVAGKRLGFEDTRGTLFFEIARIAKVKKPRVMLLENVKGLVSHDKGRTLDTIVQTLCDIGYTVDFEVLNSKYFGVPQNRERIFIIAVRDDLIKPEPWKIEGTNVVAKGKRRIAKLDGVKTFNFDWPPQEEVTTRLRDILEDNVDERFYLSEDKTAKLVAQLENHVPSNDDTKPEKIAGLWGEKQAGSMWDVNKIAPTLKTSSGGYSEPLIEDSPQMLGLLDMKGQENIRRVYGTDGVSPTLTTMGGGHREPKIAEEVRPVLTPDRENKKQNGRRFKNDGEESFTLTAQDRHGVAIGTPPRYRIRKLTPRECFRLQGFPDGEFDKLVAAGISNSQLYKMAGNAVTVNVIDAVGKRLLQFF
jgi:DNA (cytosine-5)-methyltransferase 1